MGGRATVRPRDEAVGRAANDLRAGALTLFDDPTMTVRVTGAVTAWGPTLSPRPVGLVAKVRSTVCGSSRTLVLALAPAESVAVSTNVSDEGYSWSGAGNDPLATPAKSCSGWVWQLLGQWLSTTDHVSRLGASVPSCASLAWPENAIASPTFHRRALVGASMTGTGGLLGGPTVMVTDSVSDAPAGSRTRSCAVTVPFDV